MINIMSVDVEDWYHTNGLDYPVETWSRCEDRVQASTRKVLEMLAQYRVRAVFFVLGCVAEKHPDLVREIGRQGHEIGSHGYWHRMVSRMTPGEFRTDLRESLAVLQAITGEPVRYFRAPSWSITPDRSETLALLEEEGIVCDSSLQPFRTPLSGSGGVPLHPFRPVIGGRPLRLVEIPPSVMGGGPLRIPFSGGFYLRFWPAWFSAFALRRVNRTRPGMVYAHPWELDGGIPRVEAPALVKLAQYYKLDTMERKLGRLLASFKFVTLSDYLEGRDFPLYELPGRTAARAARR